jgi:hypothetical protein
MITSRQESSFFILIPSFFYLNPNQDSQGFLQLPVSVFPKLSGGKKAVQILLLFSLTVNGGFQNVNTSFFRHESKNIPRPDGDVQRFFKESANSVLIHIDPPFRLHDNPAPSKKQDKRG